MKPAPDGPFAEANAPTAEPDGPPTKLDGTAVEEPAKPAPDGPSAEANAPTAEPDGPPTKLDGPPAEPDAPTAEPDALTTVVAPVTSVGSEDPEPASPSAGAPGVGRRAAARQRGRRSPWVWIVPAAVLAIGAAVTVIVVQSSGNGPVPQGTPTAATDAPAATATAPVAPELRALGDGARVTMPNGTVVDIGTGPGQWFADGQPVPTDAAQYLVFDLTLTHVAGPDLDVLPSQFTVRWLESNRPNTAPSAVSGGHVDNPIEFDTLGSGSVVSGQVAFVLPPTDTVVLRFADDRENVLARWDVPAPEGFTAPPAASTSVEPTERPTTQAASSASGSPSAADPVLSDGSTSADTTSADTTTADTTSADASAGALPPALRGDIDPAESSAPVSG